MSADHSKMVSTHSDSGIQIKVGIIGGSGFDDPDILKNRRIKTAPHTPYGSPSDDLIVGDIGGVPCVLLARHGRKHDIMPSNINYRANISCLKQEGCTHVIASTATGSLQEQMRPGDIVILDDFIDRTYGRSQTIYDGQTDHPQGVCHLPMGTPFDPVLRQVIEETAAELKMERVHSRGTVTVIEGPRFSTRSESKLYRSWHADLINMTSVPEVVLAKEAGLCYAAIALVTDYDAWRDDERSTDVADVLSVFKQNMAKVVKLMTATIPRIPQKSWDQHILRLQETVSNSVMGCDKL